MANLSLNGNFNYPIELKQTLTVDGDVQFNRSMVQGGEGNSAVSEHGRIFGELCTVRSDYSEAFGYSSFVGDGSKYSYAGGVSCSAYGEASFAVGRHASTLFGESAAHDTFVWNGDDYGDGTRLTYGSHGNGTFNIKPRYESAGTDMKAVCGFFIGDKCITEHISSESAKRILHNPNTFAASQRFAKDVTFLSPTWFEEGAQTTFRGTVFFAGNTSANPSFNDTSMGVINDDAVATHNYVNSVALSAVSSVGMYYDTVPTEEFMSEHSEWATPLRFVQSYVASAVNNVDEFTDKGGLSAAASREYALGYATSASTYLLGSDNVFYGTNKFDNSVVIGSARLSTTYATTADLRYGTVMVYGDDAPVTDMTADSISTRRFTRSVATSAVNGLLRGSNTYNGDNTYNGNSNFNRLVTIGSGIMLSNGAAANFASGNLTVKEPLLTTTLPNEAASTRYSRSVAASAVDYLMRNGGTFKGGVSFNAPVVFRSETTFTKSIDLNTPPGVYLRVKTADVDNSSTLAANTEFVGKYVTRALETSSVSVRELMLEGKGDYTINDFTGTTNKFLNENIYVSTMPAGDTSKHAASCEFVSLALGSMRAFDLFDTKFIDYTLPSTSLWREQGSVVYNTEFPEVYAHIKSDWDNGTNAQVKISGITVNFKRSLDGHLILFSTQDKTEQLLNATGISWFYVLNTTSRSVRLPQTQFAFDASKTDVGGYIAPAMPNHTHGFNFGFSAGASTDGYPHHGSGSMCNHGSFTFKTGGPAYSSAVSVAANNTIQPPATKMLLYFYCGARNT